MSYTTRFRTTTSQSDPAVGFLDALKKASEIIAVQHVRGEGISLGEHDRSTEKRGIHKEAAMAVYQTIIQHYGVDLHGEVSNGWAKPLPPTSSKVTGSLDGLIRIASDPVGFLSTLKRCEVGDENPNRNVVNQQIHTIVASIEKVFEEKGLVLKTNVPDVQ